MIIYAVELEMEAPLGEEYLPWLHGHVAQMLALPGFLGADILERVDPPPQTGRWAVAVHYRLRDQAAWEAYLSDHAPRMREAWAEAFRGAGARVAAGVPAARVNPAPLAVVHSRKTAPGSPPAIPFAVVLRRT